MRNRILPLIFGALLIANSGFAQKCGTYEGSLEEQIQKYPDFYQSLEVLNADLEANYKSALSKMSHLKTEYGDYGPVEDLQLVINHVLAHWFQEKLKV